MTDHYTTHYSRRYGESGRVRLTTDTSSRGRVDRDGLMRKVNAPVLPLTLYINDDDTVSELRFPSFDLDPDRLFLGGSVYEFDDDDPVVDLLADAGYDFEEI